MTARRQQDATLAAAPAEGGRSNAGKSALLVSDASTREALSGVLAQAGFTQVTAPAASDAVETAAQVEPSFVLVSLHHTNELALSIIAELKRTRVCTCVLLLPSSTGDCVTLAARSDADAVIFEPLDPHELKRIVAQGPVPKGGEAREQASALPRHVVGESPEMREVWRLVMMSARSGSSVIIRGETGVGKELVARALHRFSPRRNGPFVAVNCAAIPETLLESELFGHEKGSFTGASSQRKGRFERAHEGTLFLDEIGELPISLQVKLLRVLQERTFERVGGTQSVSVDVRVVAATHRDLDEEVKRGHFRADLFYRLNVLSIHVPPLRDRKSDILSLWQHFVSEGAARDGRASIPRTSTAASRLLMRHNWPGNIREVYNVAQHALTVTRGDFILPSDLPRTLSEPSLGATPAPNLLGLTMKEVERAAILSNYATLGSVKATAEALGISPRKVHYRLGEYRKAGHLPVRGQAALPSEAHELESARMKMRILLAEDDDDLRITLADFLKGEGYEVVAVPDGRALLEHLGAAMLFEERDAPADLIVSDMRMPGMTGMQLLESVRKRGWGTPVVLMTAFGDEEVKRKAGDLGAAAFLEKPVDVSQLQMVIDRAVAH